VAGANNDTAVNNDGSYNVVRDEHDANNSGLLALTPAVRRTHAFGMTPMNVPHMGQGTKRTSEASDRPGNFTMIEHALDVDGPLQDEQAAADGRAQVLQGYADDQDSPERHRALLEVMRSWREDAMKHHLYDTAIFWGDKILSLETDQTAWNDAYNLATAYFLTHRYAQAEHLLCTPLRLGADRADETDPRSQNAERDDDDEMDHVEDEDRGNTADELRAALESTHRSSRLPAVMLNKAKQSNHIGADINAIASGRSAHDEMSGANGDGDKTSNGSNEEKMASAWRQEQQLAMTEIRASQALPPDTVSLVSVSVPCKYLAAQCMVRQGKYQEALDELSGWKGDDVDMLEQNYRQPSKDGLIKLSSSIWHLKGLIYLHIRNMEEARESFMRSLSLDVKNYESFDQLIRGHLISTSQQWDFIENLEYTSQAGDDPAQKEALQVVKLLYTARLGKAGKLQAQRTAAARRHLIASYRLGNNPDVLSGLAEEMYERMRYEDAYAVTQRIMDLSKDHDVALPVHISSMFMIERLRPSLFLLAHHLTEVDPDLPAAWYAVGCWYFGVKRWLEARKHFSKCVQLDPRFAPGWVAFAHTFAYEGESDQAIVSYSTAERNFSANHTIKLFLGMEHLAQGNLTLAELYLTGSAEIWEEDALSRNERGVVAYYSGRMHEAIALFRSALQAAQDVQQPASAWVATHMNLAFALRRTGQTSEARACFLRAIELDPDSGNGYTGVGMCYHRDGDLDEAIAWYHRALAIDTSDKHANELLSFALQESAQHAPTALLSAADRIIEEMGTANVADKASSRDAKQAGLGLHAMTTSNDSYRDSKEETTQQMSLTEGSLSLDMDEST
jgi:anaphase-promoting complex subunit 6